MHGEWGEVYPRGDPGAGNNRLMRLVRIRAWIPRFAFVQLIEFLRQEPDLSEPVEQTLTKLQTIALQTA